MTENESHRLDLAFQNRIYCTWDISFLNSFENLLTNKLFVNQCYFEEKKKKNPCDLRKHVNFDHDAWGNVWEGLGFSWNLMSHKFFSSHFIQHNQLIKV